MTDSPHPRAAASPLGAHRWSIALGLAGLAAWSGLHALHAGSGATVPVLTAARDLSWGSAIGRDDLATVRMPVANAPAAVLHDSGQAVGRWPASAIRRGEPITDVRLLDAGGTGSVDAPVAAPVHVADAAAARMLRPGMVVDVLAVTIDEFRPAEANAVAAVVASAVRVLSISVPDDPSGTAGALVVLATTAATAARLAAAESAGRLSVTWRTDPRAGLPG